MTTVRRTGIDANLVNIAIFNYREIAIALQYRTK